MEINTCQWVPLPGFSTGGCPAVPQLFTDARGTGRLLLTPVQGTLQQQLARGMRARELEADGVGGAAAAVAVSNGGGGGEDRVATDAAHAAPARSLEVLLVDAGLPYDPRRTFKVCMAAWWAL
jgi:hypothetical protein